MSLTKIWLFAKVLKFFIPYSIKRIYQRALALHHRYVYEASSSAKNVVILGGSFAGVQLARRLNETLPTGYRVVMIEKNSHLNFLFVFPRFSVMPGYEKQAFIPYDGIPRGAPAGIFQYVRDTATGLTKENVLLASGARIDYTYLILATGSSQPFPAKVSATDREEACAELQTIQGNIQSAQKIAVLGGGAVGVEIASDIKSFYPEKDVTLVHSRAQLLPHFGKKLHDYALKSLNNLGVHVVLQERPQVLTDAGEGKINVLRFSDGHEEEFDLIIPCTGQSPNSKILADLAPECISEETNRIIVKPTLQISDVNALPHIYALGDVAETGGPKMARASFMQAEIVADNILASIREKTPSTVYKPKSALEGAIKLTLGKSDWVIYLKDDDGSEVLVPGTDGKLDLDIKRAWQEFGAKLDDSIIKA